MAKQLMNYAPRFQAGKVREIQLGVSDWFVLSTWSITRTFLAGSWEDTWSHECWEIFPHRASLNKFKSLIKTHGRCDYLNRTRSVTFERTLCEKLYTDVFWRVFIAYSLARVASVSVCFRSKERQREKWASKRGGRGRALVPYSTNINHKGLQRTANEYVCVIKWRRVKLGNNFTRVLSKS